MWAAVTSSDAACSPLHYHALAEMDYWMGLLICSTGCSIGKRFGWDTGVLHLFLSDTMTACPRVLATRLAT